MSKGEPPGRVELIEHKADELPEFLVLESGGLLIVALEVLAAVGCSQPTVIEEGAGLTVSSAEDLPFLLLTAIELCLS